MKRREFLAALGGVVLARSTAPMAQQEPPVPALVVRMLREQAEATGGKIGRGGSQ